MDELNINVSVYGFAVEISSTGIDLSFCSTFLAQLTLYCALFNKPARLKCAEQTIKVELKSTMNKL